MSTEEWLESVKNLDDTEFEIVFIDSLYKKIKSVLEHYDTRTATILFLYYSMVESLKRYKQLAEDTKRSVPHDNEVNLIISKLESFITVVINDEDKMHYAYKNLEQLFDVVKELLFVLKSELTDKPQYAHLKT